MAISVKKRKGKGWEKALYLLYLLSPISIEVFSCPVFCLLQAAGTTIRLPLPIQIWVFGSPAHTVLSTVIQHSHCFLLKTFGRSSFLQMVSLTLVNKSLFIWLLSGRELCVLKTKADQIWISSNPC